MTTKVVGGLRFVKVGPVGLCFWWPHSATLDGLLVSVGFVTGVLAALMVVS